MPGLLCTGEGDDGGIIMNLRIFLLLAGFMYELIRSCSEYRNGNEMDVDTETGDDLQNSRQGKTDLVIRETGESKYATGEKFSPPNEGQNREYSKNYNNNIDLVIDRRKNPGIERPYDLVCSPLSPPESFLRSVEMVETKVNIGLDTESEEKSGGEMFSLVTPTTPTTSPMLALTTIGLSTKYMVGPGRAVTDWEHYPDKSGYLSPLKA